MKPLTIETYFAILEKCALEAFEILELKEFYPKDGTKAIWDDSGYTIEINGLQNDIANDLIREKYIRENLRVTFLKALDRNDKKFEKKYLVTRETFYKKCYESLLYKKSIQPESFSKPDLGIDINNRCVLSFIWNMGNDIVARSKVYEQLIPEALEYSKSFDELSKIISKVPEESEIEAFQQPKLSIKHIALKLVYENVSVTKNNADEIIKKYGHSSGDKLYQQYNQLRTSGNRIDTESLGTKQKVKNRIKLIKEVSELLVSDLKDKPKQEVLILESHLLKY